MTKTNISEATGAVIVEPILDGTAIIQFGIRWIGVGKNELDAFGWEWKQVGFK